MSPGIARAVCGACTLILKEAWQADGWIREADEGCRALHFDSDRERAESFGESVKMALSAAIEAILSGLDAVDGWRRHGSPLRAVLADKVAPFVAADFATATGLAEGIRDMQLAFTQTVQSITQLQQCC
jgi:hypothetical protein